MPISKRWIEDWNQSRIIEEVPGKSGIYEVGGNVKGRSEDVLYIGKSEDSIQDRLLDHEDNNHFPGASKFRYKTIDELGTIEQILTTPSSLEDQHLEKWDGNETPRYND